MDLSKIVASDPEVTPPATVKVGDKEYTPEVIAEMESKAAKADELEGKYKSLQSDYSKKAEKAKMFDKLVGQGEPKENTAKPLEGLDKENFDYMKNLGFNPNAMTPEEIGRVLEDRDQKVEERVMTKLGLQKQIENLSKEYEFINEKELAEYMAKRANDESNPVKLTPDEAAFLLYKDKFIAKEIKPADLPQFSSTTKTKEPEVAKPKIMSLKSRDMFSYLIGKLEVKE
jgi:hypothetical protein